jgi:hypothetical protein
LVYFLLCSGAEFLTRIRKCVFATARQYPGTGLTITINKCDSAANPAVQAADLGLCGKGFVSDDVEGVDVEDPNKLYLPAVLNTSDANSTVLFTCTPEDRKEQVDRYTVIDHISSKCDAKLARISKNRTAHDDEILLVQINIREMRRLNDSASFLLHPVMSN